jgi:hypothetical protein
MNENFDRSADKLIPSAFHSIVLGWLAVGVLDAIAASTNAAVRGVSPVRVWQYVASSLAGNDSFERGATTVVIGLLIHFGVALGVAVGFYLIARLFPFVIRHAVVSGIVYGIIVYFAMQYIFVPLTMVRQGAFSWSGLITGVLIHIFFVGLPPALITRRFARPATE